MNRALASLIVAIVVATWAIYFLVQGEPLSWRYLGPFSISVGVLTAAGFVFKYWAWYWPGLHLLTKTPRLTGTWIGKLKSNYIHEGESEPREPIDVFIVISQNSDEINVRQYTKESWSTTVTASISEEPGDRFILATVFLNEPEIVLQQTRSQMHYGATRLVIEGSSRAPKRLAGNYWTARNTSGSIDADFLSMKRAHSYQEACGMLDSMN